MHRIPMGISAVKQYSKTDYALNGITIFLASVPVFVLGWCSTCSR
jgi:ABC-type dipeptide/oligopeptide/nickel transport system permease component